MSNMLMFFKFDHLISGDKQLRHCNVFYMNAYEFRRMYPANN